jgi:Holliday junction DNA helicase RuvA
MIARLDGSVLEKQPARLVVGVGGLGLEVLVPLPVSHAVRGPGEPILLHTVLVVREDALTLYGFAEASDRALFLKLIGVSGVGPKTALNALSTHSVAVLVRAIREGDVGTLTKIQGIGKKTAERIFVELRDALVGFEAAAGTPGPAAERDAAEALMALGYARQTAHDAVRRAADDAGSAAAVEDLVKRALAALSSGKR